ncbi:hypothetical protein [Atopococcus tabaci]|uniref:hypothetical protein n=1 Tax=Atopococcus tabaci TaxID=269774 RepID=UPI00068517DC|nr:hypothetical protein [Atopococcus tabaci]
MLFLAWVFLVLPNLPLAGMLVSIRQMSQRYLYLHAGAFLLVVAAGIVFFMGESTLVWGTAEDKVSDHFVLSKDSPTLFDIEPKSMLPMEHAFLLFYEGTYFLV